MIRDLGRHIAVCTAYIVSVWALLPVLYQVWVFSAGAMVACRALAKQRPIVWWPRLGVELVYIALAHALARWLHIPAGEMVAAWLAYGHLSEVIRSAQICGVEPPPVLLRAVELMRIRGENPPSEEGGGEKTPLRRGGDE